VRRRYIVWIGLGVIVFLAIIALPARKRDPTVSAGGDIDIAEPLPCIGRRITARDSRPSTLSSTSSVRRRRLIRY